MPKMLDLSPSLRGTRSEILPTCRIRGHTRVPCYENVTLLLAWRHGKLVEQAARSRVPARDNNLMNKTQSLFPWVHKVV